MPAGTAQSPDPSAIVDDPPPLNAQPNWPFLVDAFPADVIFGLGNLALHAGQKAPSGPLKINPNRFDAQ